MLQELQNTLCRTGNCNKLLNENLLSGKLKSDYFVQDLGYRFFFVFSNVTWVSEAAISYYLRIAKKKLRVCTRNSDHNLRSILLNFIAKPWWDNGKSRFNSLEIISIYIFKERYILNGWIYFISKLSKWKLVKGAYLGIFVCFYVLTTKWQSLKELLCIFNGINYSNKLVYNKLNKFTRSFLQNDGTYLIKLHVSLQEEFELFRNLWPRIHILTTFLIIARN